MNPKTLLLAALGSVSLLVPQLASAVSPQGKAEKTFSTVVLRGKRMVIPTFVPDPHGGTFATRHDLRIVTDNPSTAARVQSAVGKSNVRITGVQSGKTVKITKVAFLPTAVEAPLEVAPLPSKPQARVAATPSYPFPGSPRQTYDYASHDDLPPDAYFDSGRAAWIANGKPVTIKPQAEAYRIEEVRKNGVLVNERQRWSGLHQAWVPAGQPADF